MSEVSLGIYRLVDLAIENKAKSEPSRDYMGASILGKECSRELWYTYHTPKRITEPRVNRIFQVGHILEDYIVKLLRDAGVTVYTEDGSGEQFGFTDGPIAGHIDGVVVGLPESTKPHLLECKTANNKRFNEFVKNGYESNKTYKAQIHIYMLKMELDNCLAVVMNKDNQELYFERIKLDKKYAKRILLRGKEIAELPEDDKPLREYSSPTFYKCRFCDYAEECWEAEDV